MGSYFNPGGDKFYQAVNSEIYVDKTGLINYTNKVINTMQEYICVSRPRRFGKSMAANMLSAYYSRGCDSKELFQNYEIAKSVEFENHRNKYDVIFLNMQEFLSRTHSIKKMLDLLQKKVLWELLQAYPDFLYFDNTDLIGTMQDIYENSRIPFILIIDEWDCVFREYKQDKEAQKFYLDFLRDLIKDKSYIHLTYMTGILPIKKYGTHSALNMFDEFSMIYPGPMAEYMGFTEKEVRELCEKYQTSFCETKYWYDGYQLEQVGSVYSPKSVVNSTLLKNYQTYWNQTETFEALRFYIDMNFDGLKDDIFRMMAGESVPVDIRGFVNDMTTFEGKDDVLTLLIHLGYLGYNIAEQEIFIPNQEIMSEYETAVKKSSWGQVSIALEKSKETLKAIFNQEEKKVADAIANAHIETSHLQYNDENALSYTISLALYTARNFYTIIREMPTGKGFADLVFIPRKEQGEKPALVVELKWNKSADTAITQIKQKEYCEALKEYQGDLLLVGISYDKKTKIHDCKIEKYNWKSTK